MNKSILLSTFFVVFFVTISSGQKQHAKAAFLTQEQKEIYNDIYKQDSIFFNAFNNCDSITYKKYLTEDFEFYHDQGGLHYLDEEMLSLKEACARNSHLRRSLFKNTLEVHKIGSYGALEIGVHRFYHTNKGESEHISGDYKFIQLWKNEKGIWKLARIISYDHAKMNNN